jgi:hypothetical protein
VEGSYEYSNEPSGSIKCLEVLSSCITISFSSRAQLMKLVSCIVSDEEHNLCSETSFLGCSRVETLTLYTFQNLVTTSYYSTIANSHSLQFIIAR